MKTRMTAGRERSAGQASLSVAARDHVSLRGAGGRADDGDGRSPGAYSGVDKLLTPLEATVARLIAKAIRWDREHTPHARLTE